jgi:hypothetical protein
LEETRKNPSVKNLPLFMERIQGFKNEVIEAFEENALSRKIVKIRKIYDLADNEKNDFVTVGYDQIIDKIWFVESNFNSTYYEWKGIGKRYGRGLAESETKYILNEILNKCDKNIISYDGDLKESDIIRAIEYLDIKRMPFSSIAITNVKDYITLMHYRNLRKSHGELFLPSSFTSLTNDIKVTFFRGLPDGVSLFINHENMGELVIKKDFKDDITIQEIKGELKNKVLTDIPNLTLDELEEKLRIHISETIKFKILDINSVLILQRK